MKSQLFKTAWSLFKSNVYKTFSNALKAAWSSYKLKLALKAGKVNLTFAKISGEVTTRVATLNAELFNYTSKNNKKVNHNLITFYSLTDAGFRSCKLANLISYKAT